MDEQFFTERMLPGEHILWSGAPAQGLLFTANDIFLVPFSLAWCGFAIFWTVTATGGRAPGFFTLWGLMFVCVGLYFVFGRFIVDAILRRDTRYAVTDRRVLIARSGWRPTFTALPLDRLPGLNLIGNERRGTIRFAQIGIGFMQQRNNWMSTSDSTPQFVAIEDAPTVFNLIQRTMPTP